MGVGALNSGAGGNRNREQEAPSHSTLHGKPPDCLPHQPHRRPSPSCLRSLSEGETENFDTRKIVPSAPYAVGKPSLEVSHQSSEASRVVPPLGTIQPQPWSWEIAYSQGK